MAAGPCRSGHADRFEKFPSDAGRVKIDEGRRTHVEGEPAPLEATGSPAGCRMGLEDDGRQPPRLEPGLASHKVCRTAGPSSAVECPRRSGPSPSFL